MIRIGVIPSTYSFALNRCYNDLNTRMKQFYLIYDKLSFGQTDLYFELLYRIRKDLRKGETEILDKHVSEYEMMQKKEVLIDIVIDNSKIQYQNHLGRLGEIMAIHTALQENTLHQDQLNKVDEFGYSFYNYSPRLKAIFINEQFPNFRASPIDRIDAYLYQNDSLITSQMDVLNITLAKFPIIDHGVSWEKIIDFKEDNNSRLKLLRVLNWATDLAKQNYSANEISEKVEYLIMEYKDSLELHKIKYNLLRFQTYIIYPLELIKNIIRSLVTLDLTPLYKMPIEITKQRIELFEAEKQYIGSELAYFIKADLELGYSG